MRYTPHVGHAVLFMFLSAIFGSISVTWGDGVIVFGILFGLCLIGVIVIFALMWFDKVNENWEAMGDAAEKVSLLDDFRFELFGMRWPKYRAKFGKLVKPIFLFGDCDHAEVSHFAILLNRSNTHQVAPLREWYGSAMFRGQLVTLNREQWYEIIDELKSQKLIIPDSAAGSHSYLWQSEKTLISLRTAWRDLIVEEKQIPQDVHGDWSRLEREKIKEEEDAEQLQD